MRQPYLFVSYARSDHEVVWAITAGLKSVGVETWVDVEQLKPGQLWQREIQEALEGASGLLVFVSRDSMESSFVREEMQVLTARSGTTRAQTREILQQEELPSLIIPIILEQVADLPTTIAQHQWIDLSLSRTETDLAEAVRVIEDAVERAHADPHRRESRIKQEKAQKAASSIAEEIRMGPRSAPSEESPDSVFIVHGKNTGLLDEVVNFVTASGIEPVVLTRIGGPDQSLFQKFIKWTENIRFAIVLMSADDVGASRIQFESDGVGERALQFRARQNVIYELGFFYGTLGWENVFVVYKPPDKVFPNFELPSDIAGLVFDEIDATGQWRQALSTRLKDAGFAIGARQDPSS